MKRSAKAFWTGDLQTGQGKLTTESSVLNGTPYSFNTRFGNGSGTNPDELIAAAHAGCFTMAVAYGLSQKGARANELETRAIVGVDPAKGALTGIELILNATGIDGVSPEAFLEIANLAKENCPVSKALAGVNITLTVNYGQLVPAV